MNLKSGKSPAGQPDRQVRSASTRAFTLVELLVVIGIVALLIGLLLPVLGRARIAANITKAHADLRTITMAMLMYRQDHGKRLPPSRFGCTNRVEYELPVELAEGKYLPAEKTPYGIVVKMPDVFNPEECYKYHAPGPAIMNQYTLMERASRLWVPDSFPDCSGATGKYYNDPDTCPVRYAVWSVGPSLSSPKFKDNFARAPIPSRFWCRGCGDTGVITHYEDREGMVQMSP